ncbi:MAG: ATP-dependent helicase [archaeon]|nr:MAG: ATP-dependent helicase [archaeon]
MSKTTSAGLDFTKEQLKIISHRNGHLRIIACPGSGKTEVVSQRVVRLIEGGVAPKTIVAFTFTEKAAEELKFRIRQILEERCPDRADFGDMFVGTIHSFCFQMLKELVPEYRSYDVLDDPKRVAFLSKGANYFYNIGLVRLEKTHGLWYFQTIDRFIESADIVMTEDVDPDRITDRRFAECYGNYRASLDREKYFDFSSVMHAFVSLLRDNREVRKAVHARIKHVVVDEYQDVNRIQDLLVELLSEGADSVCVVGDDDQNIYHWRGSDVSIIRSFAKKYGRRYRVTEGRLSTNFRSTGAIIDTARSLIEHNDERLAKEMEPSRKLPRKSEPGDIIYHHFGSDNEEYSFILDKIRELLGTDFLDKRNNPFSLSYSDFAVLVRSNADAAKVVAFLDRNHIPCVAYSGTSVFEAPEVVLAMNCIAYLFGAKSYPDFGKTPTLSQLGEAYKAVFDRRFTEAKVEKFIVGMARVRKEADALLTKGKKDYFGDLGLQGFYYKILSAMGAGRFDFGDVTNYNLAALSRAISDYESVWIRLRASEVRYFFNFVRSFAESHYTDTQHSDASVINAVHVLTIHKAKGLEYPAVFIPGFETRRKPLSGYNFVDSKLYDVRKYEGTKEDERRVYYTAMTRAEKYLFISGSEDHEGRKHSYKSHPFVQELDFGHVSGVVKLKRLRSGLPPKAAVSGTYPTSFTQLNAYSRCPQDFRLRHIYQYNAGVPVTFGYGTNVHNALNIIHSDYVENRKVPDDGEIEALVNRIFKLRYATKPIADRMKTSVIRIVKNYVGLHKGDFGRILETEKKFEFALDDALIAGQIDLLKKVDEKGSVTEVEIIDFKTEQNDSIYTADYERQLRFYAIACLESLGLDPQKAYVHHLDENRKSEVDISASVLGATRNEVAEEVSKILRKQFPPRPSARTCSECDYAMICRFRHPSAG